MRQAVLGAIGWAAAAGMAAAEVSLHPLFSDHAVLQRGKEVAVFGKADPAATVTVTVAGKSATATADAKGSWLAKVGPLEAGGPHVLEATAGGKSAKAADVMVGEVWICSGQSNMEWPLAATEDSDLAIRDANMPRLRLFTVAKAVAGEPQSSLPKGSIPWAACTPQTARGFSAVGYYFGRKVAAELKNVPVGVINTSWGGTPAQAWTSRRMLLSSPTLAEEIVAPFDAALKNYRTLADAARQAADAKAKTATKGRAVTANPANQNAPAHLYNAMLHPLVPYGIKGAIWYQGESNAGRAFQYKELFGAMIRDWRARFGQGDFPFHFVQLAPWNPGGMNWCELREAQKQVAATLPNCGMAVITDVGDFSDIHPRRKKQVGERLALLALAQDYGRKVAAKGPEPDKVIASGGKLSVTFRNVEGGLVGVYDSKGSGFALAGSDGKFHPAKEVSFSPNGVTLATPEVPDPKFVRYGWNSYPEAKLLNQAGLPASPFRTDDQPWATATKRR